MSYFAGIYHLDDTAVLFVEAGAVGISAFNSYYVGNITFTAEGVQATSAPTQGTNAA